MISSVCIFFSAGMNNLRTIPIMQTKSALHYRYHRFRQFPAFPYRKRFRILNPIVPPCKRSLFFYILAFTHPLYYFRFFRVTVNSWSDCCHIDLTIVLPILTIAFSPNDLNLLSDIFSFSTLRYFFKSFFLASFDSFAS